MTDEAFQADNIDDEIRANGAGSGASIQNIQDRGFEVGGPIKTGKAWYWGSYGSQHIKVGVVGFWKTDPACGPPQPFQRAEPVHDVVPTRTKSGPPAPSC